MKSQREWLQEIMNLSNKHPDIEIHFCVDSDDILEFGWTDHKIVNVEIEAWWRDDDRIYVGENEIKEYFAEYYYENNESKSEEEIEKLANEKYEKEAKEVICVYTSANYKSNNSLKLK